MQISENYDQQKLARRVGWTILASIVLGILSAMFISKGIDINMSADVIATAENMLQSTLMLKAKAYMGTFLFTLEALVSVGLYLLLRKYGPLLAGWSLFVGFGASTLILLGSVFAMNAAQIASNEAYNVLTDAAGRQMLAGLQASSDYTSFHLGLVLSCASSAGFFCLLLTSGLIPKAISVWGVFASLFVTFTIIARDFIPVLGHDTVTMAFILSNLIAQILLGIYLALRGVRTSEA